MAATNTAKNTPDPKDPKAPEKPQTAAQAQEDTREKAETQRSALDPYPAWETMDLDALRDAADAAGVGVPADVEKGLLIAGLRKALPGVEASAGDVVTVSDASKPLPSLDLMTLTDLRSLAEQNDVTLDPEVERGYLVGQLRAAASGATAAQSAQVGSAAPALDGGEITGGGVDGATPDTEEK